jgi:hypothetical protein
VLCPVAINKYYQGAEECIYVQSETWGVIILGFLYFTPEQHREVDGRWDEHYVSMKNGKSRNRRNFRPEEWFVTVALGRSDRLRTVEFLDILAEQKHSWSQTPGELTKDKITEDHKF